MQLSSLTPKEKPGAHGAAVAWTSVHSWMHGESLSDEGKAPVPSL